MTATVVQHVLSALSRCAEAEAEAQRATLTEITRHLGTQQEMAYRQAVLAEDWQSAAMQAFLRVRHAKGSTERRLALENLHAAQEAHRDAHETSIRLANRLGRYEDALAALDHKTDKRAS